MAQCFKCHRMVSEGFDYFCRQCYRVARRQVGITDDDFRFYINRSFKVRILYPWTWCFSYVYTRLKKRIPSIKPLANILESIVFLKMLLLPPPKLKAVNSFNF